MITLAQVQKAIKQYNNESSTPFCLKAVFFDMDGVLYDSMPNHARAWSQVFEERGIIIEEQEPYMNEGATADYTVEKVYRKYKDKVASALTGEEIYLRKKELMKEMVQPPVMLYMKELVKKINQQGIDCWVVTGSGQKNLYGKLENEFDGIFNRSKMITAHDVDRGKPNPEPYLKAMQKSGFSTNEAIVIENAPLGVQASKAAGLFTIAINTGPLNPKTLNQADIVLSGSKELNASWSLIYSILNNKATISNEMSG